MKILGIETATAICSAAVIVDSVHCYERSLSTPQIHSQKLLTLIDDVFRLAKETIDSVDGIAVSIGPGSFTGLRIGLSVAKGLAYASDKPILAVPTLETLAWNARDHAGTTGSLPIVTVLESRRGEVYAAFYRNTKNGTVNLLPPCSMTYDALYSTCMEYGEVIITGAGAEKALGYFRDSYSKGIHVHLMPEEDRLCNAKLVAEGGEKLLRNKILADVSSLEPTYVKEFYTIQQSQLTIGN